MALPPGSARPPIRHRPRSSGALTGDPKRRPPRRQYNGAQIRQQVQLAASRLLYALPSDARLATPTPYQAHLLGTEWDGLDGEIGKGEVGAVGYSCRINVNSDTNYSQALDGFISRLGPRPGRSLRRYDSVMTFIAAH